MISASARRLNVFKSVVDLGGFNLAADRLGIAQPSVGAHIKALEDQIGQPLFLRRRGSRPRLTKAGETLYAHAVEVLRRSEETTHALADLRLGSSREIAIAAHRDLASHFLALHLASFASRYPKSRIVTHTGTIEEVLNKVKDGTAHIGLFLATGPEAGIVSEVLTGEPLVVVAATTNPLARQDVVHAEELSRAPLVTGLRHSRFHRMVTHSLSEIGIFEFCVAMEVQDSVAVKELVRHNAGIACLPLCTVSDDIAAGTLVRLKLQTALKDWEVRCTFQAPANDSTRKFIEHIRAPQPRDRAGP